jgi:hypothetical protein
MLIWSFQEGDLSAGLTIHLVYKARADAYSPLCPADPPIGGSKIVTARVHFYNGFTSTLSVTSPSLTCPDLLFLLLSLLFLLFFDVFAVFYADLLFSTLFALFNWILRFSRFFYAFCSF